MQVTDEMVEAAAKKLYEMRHLTRWEALGERSQDIYRVEARAMLRTAAALSDKQAGEVSCIACEGRPSAGNNPCAVCGRSALVDVPAAIPTANCCVCGRIIDTREISQGGDNFGAETAPGKWTCSMECDDAVTGYVPDVPSVEPVGEAEEMPGSNGGFTMAVFKASDVPLGTKLYTSPPLSREGEDSAEADQYWSTVEQLANCEDEISRLREILTRAEEYVIDGVTTAKAEAEMNAPYPARSPRYDAALAEVRQLYADIRAALATTRSGSASEGGDAADTIEALKRDLEQCRKVEETTHGLYQFWQKKAEKLAASNDALRAQLDEARKQAFEEISDFLQLDADWRENMEEVLRKQRARPIGIKPATRAIRSKGETG